MYFRAQDSLGRDLLACHVGAEMLPFIIVVYLYFVFILKYLYHIISTVFLACNISYTGVRLLVNFAAPVGMKENHI
jgi:hypothetical protein